MYFNDWFVVEFLVWFGADFTFQATTVHKFCIPAVSEEDPEIVMQPDEKGSVGWWPEVNFVQRLETLEKRKVKIPKRRNQPSKRF